MLNEFEYEAAMKRIEQLIDGDPELDSPEGQELDELVGQVVEYEHALYSVAPDPEIIKVMLGELKRE